MIVVHQCNRSTAEIRYCREQCSYSLRLYGELSVSKPVLRRGLGSVGLIRILPLWEVCLSLGANFGTVEFRGNDINTEPFVLTSHTISSLLPSLYYDPCRPQLSLSSYSGVVR